MSPSEYPEWDEELLSLARATGSGAAGGPDSGDARAGVGDFLGRLPAGYRSITTPAEALEDEAELGALEAGPDPANGYRLLVRPSSDPTCSFRLRRLGERGIELTSTLPLLESFGLVVVEAVPMRLAAAGDRVAVHIDDIGVRVDSPHGPEALRFVPEVHGARLVDAIAASTLGAADVDSLNRLVTLAGLEWRQVMVLRTYLRYWRQSGVATGWDDMVDPLASHPDVARALVGYFQSRFDPDPSGKPGEDAEAVARALVIGQLDLVTGREEDRVLRAVLSLIDASLRTNFYTGAGIDGRPLVVKLDSRRAPDLPAPRPQVETFVHGPAVEGVHLRAGLIARGGLRWSERPADFRTEVLDLAFAQVKKNAIIVPTGAKGGFVCRTRGRPTPDEVRAAYEVFVAGLLAVTDNLVDGQPVTPERVVAVDGADPYLVVAADKGTATFSDLANSISEGLGFWLGDAFASGGSRGYDHKAMGITAKGAWVAVRRHFRELGIDVAVDPIRVVGVGDMSGDVFGNGMLRSRAIRLVGAFDHRHVFLDPDPDPERSFEERLRISGLPRSSWADYDTALISAGGGVWSRDAKSIPLSAAVRGALGVEAESLSPPEVVSAILVAPVDLLWFGGIGTYIKALDEPDSEVADHANDAVRVTSDRVRARVIAEGANLGVTQRGRIRYSRRGGRINADFIDNAAGVATSDREVNLKILLALAIERGRLAAGDRDRYLAAAEDEVATEVLRQVDHSVAALNRAAGHSDRLLDAYEALIDDMEAAGRFDRQVEVLPTTDEFGVRRAAGAGLIRPELATVLTYAKTELVAAVEEAEWSTDPFLLSSVAPYFPAGIRTEFGDLIPDHRLYRQLVATDVAGEIVDQMGVVWAHDLAAETGRGLDEVAAAFWVSRELTGAGRMWADLEQRAADPAGGLSAMAEEALHATVTAAVSALVRRYLAESGPFRPGPAAERDQSRLAAVADSETFGAEVEQAPWADLKVPEELAEQFVAAGRKVRRIEAAVLAQATGRSPEEAARVATRLGQAAGLGPLMAAVEAVVDVSPPPGRLRQWQARAILDDLVDWRERATARVLADPDFRDPDAAVTAWAEREAAVLRQVQAVAPRAGGTDALASATLAIRRLERSLR
ncbi:MAG TPA: NAD-glutamate dehydrogenase domain-containing protein [Acidimicrobiales bacterium]|jgi:glutamate dehydrogenase|nr:NAD-glutamate dehydrogenase domain-containing protein [Acidimicrobiales bacterium]